MKTQLDRINALAVANHALNLIGDVFEVVKIGGSIRRGKTSVSDIEIIGIPKSQYLFENRLDRLVFDKKITKHDYQPNKPEYSHRWGAKYRGFDLNNTLVEVFTADQDSWGYMLWLRTGSGLGNTAVMTYLSRAFSPVRSHDGYVWHVEYPNRHINNIPSDYQKLSKLHVPDEETMFKLIGMPFIEPHRRHKTYADWYMNNTDWQPPTLDFIQSCYVTDTTPNQLSMF